MLISAIRRQRGGLFAIISQGETVALVDEQALESPELCVGCDIDEQTLAEAVAQSDFRRARTRALEIIARREICRTQLIDKLSRDFDEDICGAVADEMERLGLIDDERYAEMYAEQLYRIKRYGYRRVAHEVSQKGIDRDLAREVSRAIAPDPAEALDELLAGRLGSDLDTDAGVRRCVNSLMRYGYESGDIFAALHRLADEM